MFNPFKNRKEEAQLTSAGYHGFIAGLSAGISMVQIAAERAKSAENTNISLDRVADIMQQTLDEFLEAHGDQLGQ